MKTTLVLVLLVAAVASARPEFKLPDYLLRHLNKEKVEGHELVKPETRIIGGDTTDDHIAPYIVSMSVSKLAYAHVCAGTIIAKDWILTAAHCTDFLLSLNGAVVGTPVYAGLHDRYSPEGSQIRIVNYYSVHKGFNGEIGSDDIALLHVSEPFKFNANIQQAVLPSLKEEVSGEESSTYGWGLEDPEGYYVNVLRVGKAKVLDNSACKSILPPEAGISTNQICASSNACYGDGGSPLVIENEGAAAELFGITSWGYLPCGYNQRPTVYTAVSHYIDWIAAVQWNYYFLQATNL